MENNILLRIVAASKKTTLIGFMFLEVGDDFDIDVSYRKINKLCSLSTRIVRYDLETAILISQCLA